MTERASKVKVPEISSSRDFVVIDDPNIVQAPKDLGKNSPSPNKKKTIYKTLIFSLF